jgi:polysaccharide pyruvyl transferase WcaK-like protein
MRVVVCSECFSPNLGDGVIACGVEQLIRSVSPDAAIDFVDLSGRREYPDPEDREHGSGGLGPLRALGQRALRGSYYFASVANYLKYRRLDDRLAASLMEADRIIIGGGQLLQDNRLAFPTAIKRVVDFAQEQGIPVSFFSVGVGRNWSALGKSMLNTALSRNTVERIDCRDESSARQLRSVFPDIDCVVTVSADAALAIKKDTAPIDRSNSPLGLCIMHPATIKWTNSDHPLSDIECATEYWVGIYRALSERGVELCMFTNGLDEDQQFALKILQRLQTHLSVDPSILLPRPVTPAQLIDIISRCRCIIANRLHANIVATIQRVPCVALGWDDKVEEFMRYSGQSERYIRANQDPSDVITAAVGALGGSAQDTPIPAMIDVLRNSMATVLGDSGSYE